MTDAPEVAMQTLLFKHLESLTLAPALPIEWPDIPFVPPDAAWLAVDWLPNRNVSPFLADDAETLFRGILQVAVITPRGGGTLAPARVAAVIAAHFAGVTLRPDDESFALKVDGRPSVSGAIKEDKWTRTPVSIAWRAFA
jgi:hypothetical protein